MLFLEIEFRRVDADHDQTCLSVFCSPRLQEGQRPQAINAGICPEVDQHNLATQ